jgi:hypothetical protein
MSSILAAGTVAPHFYAARYPDQNLALSDLRGKPVILTFYPADWSPVCGDQVMLYNEILPPSFTNTTRKCWASRSTGCGAMQPSPATATCIFHCSPISNPRARLRGNTAPIVRATASANAHCSCSTGRGRLHGAIALRLRSIPARMEFLTLSKNSQIRQAAMTTLKTPITQNDHTCAGADYPC